jgi:hypothetical protein
LSIPIESEPLYGEAKGIFSTIDGEIVTYIAQGIGHSTTTEKTSFRGADFLCINLQWERLLHLIIRWEEYLKSKLIIISDWDMIAKSFEWK